MKTNIWNFQMYFIFTETIFLKNSMYQQFHSINIDIPLVGENERSVSSHKQT